MWDFCNKKSRWNIAQSRFQSAAEEGPSGVFHQLPNLSITLHDVNLNLVQSVRCELEDAEERDHRNAEHEEVKAEVREPVYLYAFSPMSNSLQYGVKFLKPSKLLEYDAGISWLDTNLYNQG